MVLVRALDGTWLEVDMVGFGGGEGRSSGFQREEGR